MTHRSVEVVIPTRNRPELVRRAIASVIQQNYGGHLRVAVVFDQQEPDEALRRDGPVPVRVLGNSRTPGLAGARNTGITTSQADLIAFLDDDDEWLPGKLERQVQLLNSVPGAPLATTSIMVQFGGKRVPRRAATSTVSHQMLLESRLAMLHSSGFLLDRAAMAELGLVDESSPEGQNEDWELLLRYSAHRPIVHLDEPLVVVHWGGAARFARAWEGRIAGARWILERHPDLRASRVGYARLLGQIAFAEAASGRRRTAARTAREAIRARAAEPRGYLALVVAAGVRADAVMGALHRFGRGV
jgi:glycosyltransferase involved in cell wall biosynthesis